MRASAASATQILANASPSRATGPCGAPTASGSPVIPASSCISLAPASGSVHAVGCSFELVIEFLRGRILGEHRLDRGVDALGRVLLLGRRELGYLAALFPPGLPAVCD